MIDVYVFDGGEAVDEDNVMVIEEWTKEELIRILSMSIQDIANNVDISDMFHGDNSPIRIQDTFAFVGNNMAQIVTDSVDGGMTYVVRK